MIRVLVVDDHQVIRSGLTTLLESAGDISVDASAASGQEAIDAATDRPPDVVLMDLSMPAMDGIEATRRLREHDPDLRVVVLTSYGDRRRIIEALDAGACGYLLKDASPEDLVNAVRAAAAGGAPMDPRVGAVLLSERQENRAGSAAGAKLSERETDVLRLVTAGRLNKQIARELGISEKTVKSHLTRVFDRLGVTDRTQAALWAEREGIFKDPTD